MIAQHISAAQRALAGTLDIRIMATTDLHMHVLGYDYFADRPSQNFGLSRVATLIENARRAARNCLLFDNGDSLQGNPMGDHLAQADVAGLRHRHPVTAALGALRCDAATIGNHDFSYGLGFLRRTITQADFPFVSSNLHSKHLMPHAPHLLLHRRMSDRNGDMHDLRIGVLGFLPPQTVEWEPELRDHIKVEDILIAAQREISILQQKGADLIIALSHSGIGEQIPCPMMENAATALAALPGIDAVIAGHTHRVFPSAQHPTGPGIDPVAGTLAGKPAVMPGFWGSHLGVIDLTLSPAQGPRRWTVTHAHSRALPVSGQDEQPVITQTAATAHRGTLRQYRRQVGRSDRAMSSYFTLIGHDPGLRLVAMAQRWHIRKLLRGTAWESLPILSAVAPFRAGGRGGPEHFTDIPAGRLTLRSLADLYLFPNRICALLIDGAGARSWLERAASQFLRATPGTQDQLLIDPDFPSYHFDLLDGLEWRIDLSQPARHAPDGRVIDATSNRIVDLSHRGRPIADSDPFVLVTNSYRLADNGPFATAIENRPVLVDGTLRTRDVLRRYVMRRRRVAPEAYNGWSFLPMPGTSVLFQTGPGALPQLGQLDRRIDDLGVGPDGFLNLRLHL